MDEAMYNEFDRPRPRAIPFKVGLMAGLLLVVTNLVLWFATQDGSVADILTWLLQLPILFFAGYSSAQQKINAQMDDLNPLIGAQGAGVGAALVTCAVIWVYTLVRNLVTDTSLFSDFLGIVRLPIDVFLALGLGAFGANIVTRRYRGLRDDFYNDEF